MTPQALQTYLHQHIPLSQAMDVTVVEASPHQVVLSAPLAPNINHRDTVFGGSASAVAILAAWSMLHLRLSAQGLGSRRGRRQPSAGHQQDADGEGGDEVHLHRMLALGPRLGWMAQPLEGVQQPHDHEQQARQRLASAAESA